MIFNLKNYYIKNKTIINDYFWRALQIFWKQGITFFIFILSAKLLTPYDFGIYNYTLAIIFFLVMFSDFGISTATSKYVTEYNILSKDKLKAILFNAGLIISSITFFVSLLLIIIGPNYFKDKYVYVLWLLPLIFLSPMTSLYDGIYRGLKKFKQLSLISMTVGLISVLFVYFLITKYGLVGALISQNIFYLILLVSLAFGYKEFTIKINLSVIKDIGRYSIIIGLAGFGFFLYSKINVLILGRFNYMIELGYYELINKIFLLIIIPFSILSQVISPNITEICSYNNRALLIEKFKKYMIISFLGGLILMVATLFLVPLILKYVLVQYYNPTILNILKILSVLIISQSMGTVAAVGFSTPSGHARLNLNFLVIFGIINVPFSIILVKSFGFIGIIYSTLFIKLLTDILFICIYYLKINKYENTKNNSNVFTTISSNTRE